MAVCCSGGSGGGQVGLDDDCQGLLIIERSLCRRCRRRRDYKLMTTNPYLRNMRRILQMQSAEYACDSANSADSASAK
jgi:hypothetical protein